MIDFERKDPISSPVDEREGEEVEQNREVQGAVEHHCGSVQPDSIARLPRLATKTVLGRRRRRQHESVSYLVYVPCVGVHRSASAPSPREFLTTSI